MNIGFWKVPFQLNYLIESWFGRILKKRTSEIIRSAIAIVIQVSLEVIYFWEYPSITKMSEPFEALIELLSVVIFDVELKAEI